MDEPHEAMATVIDESGHVWQRDPSRSGNPGLPWVCYHDTSVDPSEETFWSWAEILADATGDLERV